MAVRLSIRGIGGFLFVQVFFCHGMIPLQRLQGKVRTFSFEKDTLCWRCHYLPRRNQNATGEMV